MPTPIKYAKGYLVRFLHKGVRYRKRWPSDEWANPQAEAQRFIDATLLGQNVPTTLIPDAISRYIFYSEKVKHKAVVTVRNDSFRLKIFARYCQEAGIHRVDQITVPAVRKWQEWYFLNSPFHTRSNQNRHRSDPNSTWEKYRQVVSAFCAWAVREELLTANPASDPGLKTRPQKRVPEIFTVEELERLFKYLDLLDSQRDIPYLGAAFRFLAYTGSRPGEFWNCKWSQIKWRENGIVLIDTKTLKDRIVPMSPKLRPYLEALPRDTTYVFDNGKGEPLYRESTYWQYLSDALKEIGAAPTIGPRNLYTFRHTFAAHLCMAEVSIVTVKNLMGHSSILTTMIYAEHFTPGHKEQAVSRLPY